MAYSFEQVFAADPANPSNIAQNASITIFAPGDGTMTPIAITDPDGQPLANPIPVNANGFGSAFMADIDRVAWLGGGFTGFFTSYEGMKEVAVAAQAAAETAASTAGADAAAVADAAVATIIADAEAAAASAATAASNASVSATAAANSAALVGAPADTAVETLINSASATKAALNATYASVITPQKFGALANGSANDTAAINAAIDALVPGSTLYFPPGRYMTDGGHVIDTPSVKIIGSSGRAQTYNGSAQIYLRNGANATMLTIAANQVTIRDLTLHGQYSGQTGTSHGLVVNDGSNYLLLDAVWVTSFHDDGMVFGQTAGTLSATVTNCETRMNQGYGMKFNAGSTDTIVTTSYIDENGLSGIYCSAADISISDTHIWGNGLVAGTYRDGITFASSSGCRIVNCYIETNNDGAGIRFATGTKNDHRIIGCDIWGNGFNGIAAFQVSNLAIIGNTIRQNNYKGQAGASGSGVSLDGCTYFIVTENHFYSPSPYRQTYAYTEQNACSNGLFANNSAPTAVHSTGDVIISTAGAVPTKVRNNIGMTSLDTGNAAVRTYAAANVVHNNTTGLVTVMSLPIQAGAKYIIRGALNVDGAQAADVKFRVQATSSTSATGWFGIVGGPAASNTSTTAASINPSNAQTIAASGGSSVTAGLLGVGAQQVLALNGYVEGGSVAGTLDVQFSQNTADATDTTFHAGSSLELVRVA